MKKFIFIIVTIIFFSISIFLISYFNFFNIKQLIFKSEKINIEDIEDIEDILNNNIINLDNNFDLKFLSELDNLQDYIDRIRKIEEYFENNQEFLNKNKKFYDYLIFKKSSYTRLLRKDRNDSQYLEITKYIIDNKEIYNPIRMAAIYYILHDFALSYNLKSFLKFIEETKELKKYIPLVFKKIDYVDKFADIKSDYELVRTIALFLHEISNDENNNSLAVIANTASLYASLYTDINKGKYGEIQDIDKEKIKIEAKKSYDSALNLFNKEIKNEINEKTLATDIIIGMNHLAIATYTLYENEIIKSKEVDIDVLLEESKKLAKKFAPQYQAIGYHLHALLIAKRLDKKSSDFFEDKEKIQKYLERNYSRWAKKTLWKNSVGWIIANGKDSNIKSRLANVDDIVLLANIDPKFKEWLIKEGKNNLLGWKEDDFLE